VVLIPPSFNARSVVLRSAPTGSAGPPVAGVLVLVVVLVLMG